MTYNFNPDKYKNTFNNMFGSGSYTSQLEKARAAGRKAAQAELAVKMMKERQREEEKRREESRRERYTKNKEEYYDEQVRRGNLDIDDVPDGKLRSEVARAKMESIERMEGRNADVLTGKKYSGKDGYIGELEGEIDSTGVMRPTKYQDYGESEKKKKEDDSGVFDWLLGKHFKERATNLGHTLNPFDDVTAKEAAARNRELNKDESPFMKESNRAQRRIMNTASLGLLNNLEKKDGIQTDTFQNRKGAAGAADNAYDIMGYLFPGTGIVRGLRGVGLGAKIDKGAKLGTRLGQTAKEGALAGLLETGAEVGFSEGLNPKDQNWKQNLEKLGLGVAGGAALDSVLGEGLPALFKALGDMKKAPKKFDVTQNPVPDFSIKAPDHMGNDLMKTLDSINAPKELATTAKQFEAITPEPKAQMKRIDTEPKFEPFNPNEPLPDTSVQVTSKTKQKSNPAEMANRAYTASTDDIYRLNQFTEDAVQKTGKPLKESEDPYKLALNSRGSDMISKTIATDKLVDAKGNVVGKSLKDVMEEVPKEKYNDFVDYLVNNHAVTRMNRGEKVFDDSLKMSPEKSKAIVDKYEKANPKFKEWAEDLTDFRNKLAKTWLVDTGVIPESEFKAWVEANPTYIPNKRHFDDLERPQFRQGKRGYAGQSNPVKKATGSQRKIIDPIESTIEDISTYVKVAKRNEVMQSLIKNIQKNPEGFKGWAEIVPTEQGVGAFSDSLEGVLEKEGIDGVLEKFNQVFEQKPDLTKGNIVTGIVDGKKVHIKVNDPGLLKALTNIQPESRSKIIGAIGQATRVMKTLTTGVNPIFSLTRNVFRDIPTAYFNSKTTDNPFRYTKDLVSSIIDVIGNREMYQSYKRIGGGHSSPISSDINLLAQSKREILPQMQKGARNKAGKVIGVLENLNNAVESAPRLGEFRRNVKQGDYDSQVRALYEANDITVNFNKRGDIAKEADAIVPYLNAAIQGYDKLVRTYLNTKDPKFAAKVWAKTIGGITIPTMALYAVNHDNPRYKELPDYIKDNYFVIPTTGETFIRIPKPHTTGVTFGALVERSLAQWKDQDPEAFKGFAESLKTAFGLPSRTILHPAFVDLPANKNFADIPIVPGDLEGLSPENQYDPRTSEPAKFLGKMFNQSPKQLDYLASSYGGIIADIGKPLTTKDTGTGPLDRFLETLKRQVTSDPVFSNDLMNDFYTTKEKLDTAKKDYNATGERPDNMNEELRKYLGRVSRNMSDVRKEQKKVLKNQSISADEREERIRELQKRLNEMAREANQQVEEVRN